MQIGTRFSHHQIVARLGAGGMGEVYRAHDSRLRCRRGPHVADNLRVRPRRVSTLSRVRTVPWRICPLVVLLATASVVVAGVLPPPPARAASGDVSVEGIQGLIRSGRYADAERRARLLLSEVAQIHGPESLEAANVLDLLADALRLGGKAGTAEALEVCRHAVRIKEKELGAEAPGTAASIHNLGALYWANGDYVNARASLEQALGIRERTLDKNHPDIARSLLYLANLDISMGHENAAKPILERAIAIQRASLSPTDPETAQGLNMLGTVLYNTGDYSSAGPAWEQALFVRERSLGVDHPYVGESLHNLGVLHAEMGNYDDALQYLERALAIRKLKLGRNHPFVAFTLSVIAFTNERMGRPAAARRQHEAALAIRQRLYPGGHPDLAHTMTELGRLAVVRGDFSTAKPLLERALTMQEQSLGEDHPDVASSLSELAVIAEHDGASSTADQMFRRALRIQERAYGPTHPDLTTTLGRYASFLVAAGDTAAALEAALRAAGSRVEHLRTTARGLAEHQALDYAMVKSPGLDVALTLAARESRSDRPVAAIPVWDLVIRTRTLVLDEMAARQRAATADSDTSVVAARRDLESARNRFANLLTRGAAADDPEHYRSALDRARHETERAERALAAVSARFRQEEAEARVGWQEVAAGIMPGAALVAFATYDSASVRSYIAFVLTSGGNPVAVPLGPAAAIDSLVLRWTAAVANGGNVAASGVGRAEAACRAFGADLRRRIWDPVAALPQPVDRVFVVPDGSLHLVNFAALPAADGTYLVESGPVLHYLSSERDLVTLAAHRMHGLDLLALGGPAFDGRETSLGGAGDSARAGEVRGAEPDCDDFRATKFRPLPETIREVEEIAAFWPDSSRRLVLTGTMAGETALKARAPGRRVLHLATHGFFLDANECAGWKPGVRGVARPRGIGGVQAARPSRARTAGRQGGPLLLSGLALAGANLRAAAKPDEEDGILTAQEVASLDLSGVEWVVLSACDTGLGHLQSGEGVLGLRRAFQIAGASTVIMSLWEVEDRAARRWMSALYEARLKGHAATADAVRQASLAVLRERRAQARSTHPYYWAAFVAAGDWD